ncbi:hypothetical protein VP01_119g16 [Puccinia sorghi]|uniref:Uncharacterized protein n=1 Tax=Puccinia sorghi TaxID=27349 RepID=A0A0L6VS39_9BASI|nr:hypothetical protein VP01_119g16 [Puccinia sorghi]
MLNLIILKLPLYNLMIDHFKISWARCHNSIYKNSLEMLRMLKLSVFHHFPLPKSSPIIKFPVGSSKDSSTKFIVKLPGINNLSNKAWKKSISSVQFTMWPLFECLSMPHIISIYGVAQFATAKLPSIGKVPFFKRLACHSWVKMSSSQINHQSSAFPLSPSSSYLSCGAGMKKKLYTLWSQIGSNQGPAIQSQAITSFHEWNWCQDHTIVAFDEMISSLTYMLSTESQDLKTCLGNKWREHCILTGKVVGSRKGLDGFTKRNYCMFIFSPLSEMKSIALDREDETMLSEIVPHIGLFIGSGRRSSMNHNQQISLIIYMDQYMILDFMSSMTHGLESRKKHPRISISQLTNIPIRSFSPHRTQICVNYVLEWFIMEY